MHCFMPSITSWPPRSRPRAQVRAPAINSCSRFCSLSGLVVLHELLEHLEGGEHADVQHAHREEKVLGDGAKRGRDLERRRALGVDLDDSLSGHPVEVALAQVGVSRVEPAHHVVGRGAQPRLLLEVEAVGGEEEGGVDLGGVGRVGRREWVAQVERTTPILRASHRVSTSAAARLLAAAIACRSAAPQRAGTTAGSGHVEGAEAPRT